MIAGTVHKILPSGEVDGVRIVHDSPCLLERARAMRDGQPLLAQTYTRLIIDGSCWMTDAEFEIATNKPVVAKCRGDVLIVGLGIGLIIPPLIKSKRVRSITVLEKDQRVIDLVSPTYCHEKIKVVRGDAYKWMASKAAFDCIYLDIWPNVPNSDDRKNIARLRHRFSGSKKSGGWIKVWCEGYV